MKDALLHLNYLHVLVVTVAGFILGCLWSHGPLFGNVWLKEMNLTKGAMEAALMKKGMTAFFLKTFGLTLLSTFGIAVLTSAVGVTGWQHGAAFGAFVGVLGPGVRLLHSAAWETHSVKLQAINVSHEAAIYALQGALLAAWH